MEKKKHTGEDARGHMAGSINMCSLISGKVDGLDHVLQPEITDLGFGEFNRELGLVATMRKPSGAILRICAEDTTASPIGITR